MDGVSESIYDFLVGRLNDDGSFGANPPVLPDESHDPSSLSWSAGALDGIPIARQENVGDAATIASAIAAWVDRTTDDRARRVHSLVAQAEVLQVVDVVLKRLTELRLDRYRIEGLGRWLATKSPHRSAVKVGIGLLGIARTSETKLLMTLGAHDEFTLFVAVALRNLGNEQALFELAKRVHGWGRVQAVDRLAGSNDPEIKRWMLVDGFRNGVMYEYLAMTCATTGDLSSALAPDRIDDELLTGAGEIIEAMIQGEPGPPISSYVDAVAVIDRYLTHVSTRNGSLAQRHVVSTIRNCLLNDQDLIATDIQRAQMLAVAEEFLNRGHFTAQVKAALRDPDYTTYWFARAAARDLEIDTFEDTFWRVETNLDEHPFWSFLLESVTKDQLQRSLALGRQLLDLDAIATGPSLAIGLGPEFKPHSDLTWFLQALVAFPGEGWDFVLAGLQSPSVQNRNWALRVLQHWPRNSWPAGVVAALTNFVEVEMKPDLEQRARGLLAD